MRISLAEAEGQLGYLVEYAEAGSDIILTRDGHPVARLVAVAKDMNEQPPLTREQRRAILDAARAGAANALPGPSAARSQDFSLRRKRYAGMIVVDTSALLAIVLNEKEAPACSAALEAETEVLMSAAILA